MAENKVQFNLKNAHYAVLTETTQSGTITESWATPVPINGAVSIQIDPEGSVTPFYADGIKYFVSSTNAGYSGTLEIAKIHEQMLSDIWGFAKDSKNVLTEDVNTEIKDFALMFQIDGDIDNELYCFYKVTASRPSISSATNTDSTEVRTQTLSFSCAPLSSNGKIQARTTSTTDSATKSGWFGEVYK